MCSALRHFTDAQWAILDQHIPEPERRTDGRGRPTVGGTTFDALVFGYYRAGKLIYAARTRNGFTPKVRAELMKRFKPLATAECPFANLSEKKAGRWGAGLTAAKMQECRWLRPVLVGQFS